VEEITYSKELEKRVEEIGIELKKLERALSELIKLVNKDF